MYAHTNRVNAIRLTIAAMTVIVCRILSFEVDSLPLKAAATLPITKEIDGNIAPAATAAKVPIPNSNLSVKVRYEKNLMKGICLPTSYWSS